MNQNPEPSPSRIAAFWISWGRCIKQHIALGVLAYLLYRFFFWTKAGLPSGHQVNRSWADASVVFLFASLLAGPLNRLWPRFKVLIPWRRDIGLWFAITGGIHIGLLAQRRGWNVLGFFFNDQGEFLKAAAHASNWVGLLALALTFFLVLTSNKFSETLLGHSSWKFVQQSAYSVFLLSVLHTFIFVYQVDARKSEAFRWVFWIGIALVCGFQLWGLIYTTRLKRRSLKTRRKVSL